MQCIRLLSRLSDIGVFLHSTSRFRLLQRDLAHRIAHACSATRPRVLQTYPLSSFSAVESSQYFIRMDYVNISSDSPLRRSTWQSLSIRCTKPAKLSARRSSLMTSPSAYTLAQKSASWVQTAWESPPCSRSLPA